MLSKDVDALQPHIRAFVERAVTFATLPRCDRTELNEGARSSKIEEINIADACAMPSATSLTGSRPRRAVGRAVAHRPARDARRLRRIG